MKRGKKKKRQRKDLAAPPSPAMGDPLATLPFATSSSLGGGCGGPAAALLPLVGRLGPVCPRVPTRIPIPCGRALPEEREATPAAPARRCCVASTAPADTPLTQHPPAARGGPGKLGRGERRRDSAPRGGRLWGPPGRVPSYMATAAWCAVESPRRSPGGTELCPSWDGQPGPRKGRRWHCNPPRLSAFDFLP